MALPYKLAVVGVPTLEITAYPFRDQPLPVWALAQAGRGRILAACYAQEDDQWQLVTEPYLTNLENLGQQIKNSVICTGEINQSEAKILQHVSSHRVKIVSPAARLRRSGYLAEIAARRLEANEQDDPDALVPLYVSSL
jgi:tRNA A37 threonylcarbamoyladenosine modification protein TsaB